MFQWKEERATKFFNDTHSESFHIFNYEYKRRHELYQMVAVLFDRMYLMVDLMIEILEVQMQFAGKLY